MLRGDLAVKRLSGETVLHRVHCGLGPIIQAKFAVEAPDMGIDRIHRKAKLNGDGLIGEAAGNAL
jgi:hypothetical protein